jgi:hypothetical protein
MTNNCCPVFEKISLRKPFQHDGGYAWLAPIEIEGDGVGVSEYFSNLTLFENDIRLGPARSAHAEIREHGCGRFSHWNQSVYFSASDNTDPNTNGREYVASVTARDTASDCAHYGIKSIHLYIEWLGLKKTGNKNLPLQGLKIFELGPGPSMSTAMVIAALGGIAYVRERNPILWEPKAHGDTAKKMLDVLRHSGEPFDPEPLERCLAQGAFDPAHIVILNQERSVVASMLAGAMDVTISTAVLEHVEDLEAELLFLHDISKNNSKSAHSVDFRDHYNNEKPLEFLILGDEDFLNSCEYRYSRGSRVRFQQLQKIAESIGFRVDKVIQAETDTDYLKEFIPRLRQSSSRYKDMPADWLKILSAVVCLEKP